MLMINIQLYHKGTKEVEQKFKQKIMNVLWKDYFHKINCNRLSILDNEPVLYSIVLYGNQQIDLTSYFN